jgi:hypothetical protein
LLFSWGWPQTLILLQLPSWLVLLRWSLTSFFAHTGLKLQSSQSPPLK